MKNKIIHIYSEVGFLWAIGALIALIFGKINWAIFCMVVFYGENMLYKLDKLNEK